MTAFLFTKMLTHKKVSELLRYDPETGKIFWKVGVGRKIKAGVEAGTLMRRDCNTYRRIMIDGKLYRTHRIAWLLHFGVWPDNQIDHRDGDGLNNRIENMRDATNQENRKNQRMYRNNTSGVTGVTWDKLKGKWRSAIYVSGKRKCLGYFDDKEKAAIAYRKTADKLGYTERHGLAV